MVDLDLPVDEYDAIVDDLSNLYIYTTADDKELPIYVCDSVMELSRLTHSTEINISSQISKYNRGDIKTCRYKRVDYKQTKLGNRFRFSRSDAQRMAELVADGFTMTEIAQIYGCKDVTVKKTLTRFGMPYGRKD